MSQKKIEDKFTVYLEGLFGLQPLNERDERVNTLLDELPVCFWMHDEQYSVVYANRAVNEKFGPCHGRKCHECFMGGNTICTCCQSKSILEDERDRRCTHCKRSNNTFDINIYHIPLVSEDGKKYIIKSNVHIQDVNILGNRFLSCLI